MYLLVKPVLWEIQIFGLPDNLASAEVQHWFGNSGQTLDLAECHEVAFGPSLISSTAHQYDQFAGV